MIDLVAYNIAKDLTTTLSFTDKWSGLVKPLRKKIKDKESVFPVSISNTAECSQSDYTALIPDSTKKSVIYIEKTGDVQLQHLSINRQMFNATLRVVCWYNLDKITGGDYISEDIIVQEVYKNIPKRIDNLDNVKQIHIEPTNIIYGSDVFSAYTYDEVKTQYGLHPYGYFAIDIDVWGVVLTCQPDINPITGCKTGMGEHQNYNND